VCYNPAVKVSELGEFGLIRLLADVIDKTKIPEAASWQKLLIGIGDDTAAWRCDAPIQLATTDSLIQDVHFDLNTSIWEELGWKSIAVNLSDIAAMGGVPQYALVSLALPGDVETDNVSKLYHGMVDISNQFGVAIVGGNISSASKVMITITVLGVLKNKSVLTRSAAKVGDQIAITGYTGLSAAGLWILRQNLSFDSETGGILREAHLKPVPRVKEGQILLRHGVRAAIDISDGLIADLTHICEASKVSARVRQDLVPVHHSLQTYFKSDCQQLVLSGGEDYELLFTAASKVIEKVRKLLPCPVTVIGEITERVPEQVTVIDAAGKGVSWQQVGWEHFRSRA
jgi:thiamine-monophosphate kinase